MRRRAGTKDVVRSLGQPRVLIMLLLGFSCGLPFMLVGNTMGYWAREEGVELAAIGFLSWVGLAYSLKFLWAPIVDKVDAPILGLWMGRRRSWMVLSQIVTGGSLLAMAAIGPDGGLVSFAIFALIAAFGAATQDIVVDAWRIERSETDEELGLLTSAHQLGYRAALLCTDALILIFAAQVGWATSYLTAGLAMGIGVAASLAARETVKASTAAAQSAINAALWTGRGLYDAVLGPFLQFFRQHGAAALLMLAAISLYRLPDFIMGPMANPLYADVGLAKETVGAVRASFGLAATIAGIALAGLSAVRLGFIPTLLLGAILGPASNLAFSAVALSNGDPNVFIGAMIVDNVSTGFAGTALVAYMSSLTSIGYTATQYALLSSFYALLGKFLKGFSGAMVEALERGRELHEAYAIFFAGTAAVGLPALILCWILARRHRREADVIAATAPA